MPREVNAEICYASKYVSESYKDCLLTAMGTSEWHAEPCIQLNINCWSECQQEHVTGPVHGGCEVGISPLLFNHSPLERTHSKHKGARAQFLNSFISASHISFCSTRAFISDDSLFGSEGGIVNLLVLVNTGTTVIASGLKTLLPLRDEPFMK